MKFEEVLSESYDIAKLKYSGSREDYKINDPEPLVLVLDDSYDVDKKGNSVLGINLNYYDGDKSQLMKDVQKADNEAGFRWFELKAKAKKMFANKKKEDDWEKNKRIERYKNFAQNFPYMLKFIRRYKKDSITYIKKTHI